MGYNRVEIQSLSMPDGGLAGPYQFGSLRGSDRLLLLWSFNASGIIAETQGHKVFVAAWDAANAFPTLWRHGVSWVLWKKGVRGKIWRILHLIETGLDAFL
jgi:hypothetical protein